MSKRAALVVALLAGNLNIGNALAENPAAKGEKALHAAAQFLSEYEKRDKACDPSLISLYDDKARIESEVERQGEPLIKKSYNKEEYKKMIDAAFALPETAKASASTVYGEAKTVAYGGNECTMEFTASHGASAVRITWHLRREEAGAFKILKEESLTYLQSLGAEKPSPLAPKYP
jgi:hypothetical protein